MRSEVMKGSEQGNKNGTTQGIHAKRKSNHETPPGENYTKLYREEFHFDLVCIQALDVASIAYAA